MTQIPNATMDVLTDFVLDNVQVGSQVRTDGWKGYNAVGRHRFEHVLTSLKASDDHAHVVLPAVHRVASLLKRWLLGTHQGAVSHEHLGYYLDEFTFRFNRRRARHRGLLFYRLIEGALATTPQPYNTLTAADRHRRAIPLQIPQSVNRWNQADSPPLEIYSRIALTDAQTTYEDTIGRFPV